MSRSKKVNPKDKEIICNKFLRGVSVTELASEFDITRNTVKNYLKEGGLWKKQNSLKIDINDKRVRQILNSSMTASEIAKELNCSLDTVRRKKMKLEGKKAVNVKKRIHIVEPEVKGGIRLDKTISLPRVQYNGKHYVDVTYILDNYNDLM